MDFNEMLDEVYEELGTVQGQMFIIPNADIEIGTTRIIWKNVKDFLSVINTKPLDPKPLDPENLKKIKTNLVDFIKDKLQIDVGWVSSHTSDGVSSQTKDGLVIHNKKIKAEDLEDIMKKYIKTFIICKSCNKTNTEMYKDNDIRAKKIKCKDCNSDYTVT